MKKIKIQEAFEREINMLDNDLEKPASTDTEYWVNSGILKFVKTRFTGNNYKGIGFEQTQKRIDDLRLLETSVDIKVGDNQRVELPNDYMYLLGDRVGILPTDGDNKCWNKDIDGEFIIRYTDPLEATIETLDRMLENSLSEHNLKYCQAKPIKLMTGNTIQFYTDENYYVAEYKLYYLKKPATFSLNNPFGEYTSLPDEVLYECIKIAAQMFIENQQSQRYNTITNEVNTME